MALHSHRFVEEYDGLVGYGLDRTTDEATLCIYLQKFADDNCLKTIVPRLTDDELGKLFDQLSYLLKRHLEEEEYHSLFLKEDEQEF